VGTPDSGGVQAAGAAAVRPRWASHRPKAGPGARVGQVGRAKRWAGDEVEGGRADLGSWAVEKRRWAVVWELEGVAAA
jgi:hypothetical protein